MSLFTYLSKTPFQDVAKKGSKQKGMFHVKQFTERMINASPPQEVTGSGSLYLQSRLPHSECAEVQEWSETGKKEYNRVRQAVRRKKEKSGETFVAIVETFGFFSHYVARGVRIDYNSNIWAGSTDEWDYIQRALRQFLTCNETGFWIILLCMVSGIPETRRASLPYINHVVRLWKREQEETSEELAKVPGGTVQPKYQFVAIQDGKRDVESRESTLSPKILGRDTEA